MASKRLAGSILAATVILAAGCGGSSKSSSSASSNGEQPASTSLAGTPPATTTATNSANAQFIASAGAICLRLNKQTGAISVKSLRDVARTMPRVLAYERAALAELRKLTPPKELASDWRAMLADLRRINREALAMGRFARQNDSLSVARINLNVGNIQRHRIAIAKRDHITGCMVTT